MGRSAGEKVGRERVAGSSYRALAVGTARSTEETSHLPRPVSARMLKLREMPTPVQVAVYSRDDLGAGARLAGPSIIEQPDATTVMLAGQAARVDGYGNLWIKEDTHG